MNIDLKEVNRLRQLEEENGVTRHSLSAAQPAASARSVVLAITLNCAMN